MPYQYKVYTCQKSSWEFWRRFDPALWLLIVLYMLASQAVEASPSVSCNQNGVSTPPNELKLSEDAVRGNATVALQVSNFYLEQGDLPSAELWSSISAEDGGAENEYNYAEFLMNRDDTDSQVRSIFWMQRALNGADTALTRYINLALPRQMEILSNNGNLCIQSAKDINGVVNLPNLSSAGRSGLVDEEPLTLRIQALCGNLNAARFLVDYYDSLGVVSEASYFTKIGAENGDSMLQLKLAEFLSQQLSDQQAQTRAKFWALRVLKGSTDPKLLASAKSIIARQDN